MEGNHLHQTPVAEWAREQASFPLAYLTLNMLSRRVWKLLTSRASMEEKERKKNILIHWSMNGGTQHVSWSLAVSKCSIHRASFPLLPFLLLPAYPSIFLKDPKSTGWVFKVRIAYRVEIYLAWSFWGPASLIFQRKLVCSFYAQISPL